MKFSLLKILILIFNGIINKFSYLIKLRNKTEKISWCLIIKHELLKKTLIFILFDNEKKKDKYFCVIFLQTESIKLHYKYFYELQGNSSKYELSN